MFLSVRSTIWPNGSAHLPTAGEQLKVQLPSPLKLSTAHLFMSCSSQLLTCPVNCTVPWHSFNSQFQGTDNKDKISSLRVLMLEDGLGQHQRSGCWSISLSVVGWLVGSLLGCLVAFLLAWLVACQH